VTSIIGKGHFAKVYLAHDIQNQKEYAIKAFSKEYFAKQDKGKESLINEIYVLKHLSYLKME